MMLVVVFLACAARLDPVQRDRILVLQGDPSTGQALFEDKCKKCHGREGNGDGAGPELTALGPNEAIVNVLKGPAIMPSFRKWSDEDLAAIVAYVTSL